jgi:hypothetical protein
VQVQGAERLLLGGFPNNVMLEKNISTVVSISLIALVLNVSTCC